MGFIVIILIYNQSNYLKCFLVQLQIGLPFFIVAQHYNPSPYYPSQPKLVFY